MPSRRRRAVPALAAILLHPQPYAAQPVAAAAVFAGAAVTDWADGYLARRLGATSAFGAFLDPVADKLMVCTAFVCLAAGVGGWGRAAVIAAAAVTVCREVGVSALREWMAGCGVRSVVRVGVWGKVKTAVQMAALTLLLGCWGGWGGGGYGGDCGGRAWGEGVTLRAWGGWCSRRCWPWPAGRATCAPPGRTCWARRGDGGCGVAAGEAPGRHCR
ncbi:hypothetical protein BU14_0175s0009 [Porphyra umbilicalis]|uniref:CDP-diacylglycerol--glycerol-3-phosphate 3-phosphatidyltransferase n=1 Tax=Porphyra umbilicalis TaxID=2786 RepID=A0A1X6P7S6_PORUM|nr:hypothetical protein BU14_0175s0009 [Porphyra umbilicalis]|eukprot:OSX76816.1 hypothetical protein BU14_0175s0009 [Porphyra umbilicalis]